ncbi:Hypothetical predicted protein [Paramuricea clavata]|uniref:Uncharacterized protein n=1 Tax=Paramuricea clavata TaxID=317549 RepID=A0A7D9IJ30_PARCT|nr:Hypothetical predicted protein [Paramuricea clavata]
MKLYVCKFVHCHSNYCPGAHHRLHEELRKIVRRDRALPQSWNANDLPLDVGNSIFEVEKREGRKHHDGGNDDNSDDGSDDFDSEEDDIEETKSPLEYFRQFRPDEINDLVVEQTNLYSTHKTGTSINTNIKETEQLIGMHLKMSIIQLPSYKLYWSQN